MDDEANTTFVTLGVEWVQAYTGLTSPPRCPALGATAVAGFLGSGRFAKPILERLEP